MMDKDTDSMNTVQMKPEYAASEVYSTVSEAPPAYKMRKSNSVQIAKIVGITIIVSSFIIGSFVLASTYLQAKASCDQMSALDAVLDKELMLEAMQQELPKAEALQGREANDIENLEKDMTKKETVKETETESQSNDENDESEEMNHVQIKLPTGLQLGDIANAILETNQKSRMNCVVERRRSEEFVDTPAKTVQLPFGLNIKTEPKKQKLTGERMVIVCESKTGEREEEEAEPSIRQFIMPMHPVPLQYGPRGPQFPLTHMPQQMQPQQQMIHQMIPQMQQIPPQFMAQHPQQQQIPQQQQQPPIPATMMQAPRPEQQEVRIQLHRVQIPIQVQNRDFPIQVQNRDYPQQENKEMEPNVQLQQVPLAIALQRAGITAEDLSNIQRMAEARIQEELQQLSSNDDSSDSEESSEEEDSEQQQQPQILQINRMGFGRSLHTPIRIPVPMMESIPESERPHYVQPRSVPSEQTQ